MKVALVNHTPIVGSGSGTYTAMIARGLIKTGNKVCVITPLATQFPIQNAQNISVNLGGFFPSFTGHTLSPKVYSDYNKERLKLLLGKWVYALESIVESFQPDIIHIQHLWIIAKAANELGLQTIVTSHGSEIDFANKNPLLSQLLFPEMSKIDAVINISNYVANQNSSIIHSVKTYNLPNPYDNELFYPPKQIKKKSFTHIGFVGRLVPYKRCHLFIKTVALLKDFFPDLKASIIGDGPERSNLELLSSKLELTNVIHFHGEVNQENLQKYYSNFDILITPSIGEPFGLVAIECVACGTPVIVFKDGGLEELISPPFIYGFTNDNPSNIAKQVAQIIAKKKGEDFRRSANQFIHKKYSLDTYIENLIKVYILCLNNY